MSLNRLSNSVGGVKQISGTLILALSGALFRSSLRTADPTQGSLVNPFQVRNAWSDPCISSVTTSIMITTSNSPRGEREAQSIARCSTPHPGDFRALPRANQTAEAGRSPSPCATSSTSERPTGGPWRPWRSSVPAASPNGKTGCAIPDRCGPSLAPLPPARNATGSPLLADVSQSSPIPTGLFRRHQSQVARDRLA